MSEHASEREQLIESLPLGAGSEQWAALEERMLGRTSSCPPVVQLLRLSRGLVPPEEAPSLQKHADSCPYCRLWVAGAQRGPDDPLAASVQRFHEQAAALPDEEPAQPAAGEPGPVHAAALEDWSVPVHSGTFASAFRHVHHPRELLEELRPVMEELLADVGLSPDTAEPFLQFGLRQAEDNEWRQAAAWLPRTLERFAREALGLTGLPCVLDRNDWEAIFTRTALRYLILKPPVAKEADKAAASGFYERLLERGTESWQEAVGSLEEQRRLATETRLSEAEVRQLVFEGSKCRRSIAACCLSPTRKR
jgi:hypothetical protein